MTDNVEAALAAIAALGEDDASAIEAEIEKVKSESARRVGSLSLALKLARGGVEAPRKPRASPGTANGKGAKPPARGQSEIRLKLAGALIGSGQMTRDNVPRLLGLPPGPAAMVYLNHPWFAVEGDRVLITPAGRQANG